MTLVMQLQIFTEAKCEVRHRLGMLLNVVYIDQTSCSYLI